jgi:hypothetical protein
VEHRVAGAQVEPGRDVGRSGDALDRDHLAAVVVTALADFARDVGDLQQRRLRLVLGHEAADAGHAHDAALLHQLTQCAVDRHARHAELRDQLMLRRQAVAGWPGAVLDLPGDVILDLRVEREGRQVAFHVDLCVRSWHCCSGRVRMASGTPLRECPPLRSSFISLRGAPDAIRTVHAAGLR